MQLKQVKVSNIVSFEHISNMDNFEGIKFHTLDNGGVNILIGPNGTGKSSFLNIIKQLITVGLVNDYEYNKSIIDKKGNRKNTIIQKKIKIKNLDKNYYSKNKNSKIFVNIQLSKNDMDNIHFLCVYNKLINSIIKKYSKLNIKFDNIDFGKLNGITNLYLDFKINYKKKTVDMINNNLNKYKKFIVEYFKYQELIQICMNIYNEFERKKNQRKLYALKNNFALMPVRKTNNNIGYDLCIEKVGDLINEIRKNEKIDINNNFEEVFEKKLKYKVKNTLFFSSLVWNIKNYLNFDLDIIYEKGNFEFVLIDESDYKFGIEDISTGYLAFLMIILTIYGYDLENGLLVIDEPESHLHPQMQKNFIEFIQHVSKKFNLQVIFATHSPVMINDKNIYNVYKFSKNKLKTVVNNPSDKISADESDLIQMLKFENISKIFFVDKIILVEGETDVYFFGFYLNYLRKHYDWAKNFKDFEILNIQGKGSFKRWKKFLSKFGIESYFIGDWDNVLDSKIISSDDLGFYRKQLKKYYGNLNRYKNYYSQKKYGMVVDMLKYYYPSEYKYITDSIEWMYTKNFFVLKKGDLETYLGTSAKGLDETIKFCNKKFWRWLNKNEFNEHREELKEIFKKIFD